MVPEMSNLVDEVLRNQAFANFVPKAPVVVVKSEPVVVIQEQPQVVEVKVESRKQSEVAARKDSEAQQQFFMQDDSEDEQEVREEPAPVAQVNVTVTESENKQAPADEKKNPVTMMMRKNGTPLLEVEDNTMAPKIQTIEEITEEEVAVVEAVTVVDIRETVRRESQDLIR